MQQASNPTSRLPSKLSVTSLKKIGLWPGWFYRWTQQISFVVMVRFLQVWCGLSFNGHHHLTDIRQCLFAPTHCSHLDFWAVLAGMPFELRQICYVAAARDHFYSRSWLRFFTKLGSYHNFPFERFNLTPSVYQQLTGMIQAGCSLLMFPEGSRSRDGQVQPFKSLLALLAVETQQPVVPVAVKGTFAALPADHYWIKPRPITVSFGQPLQPPRYEPDQGRKQLLKLARAFNADLMAAVNKLII